MHSLPCLEISSRISTVSSHSVHHSKRRSQDWTAKSHAHAHSFHSRNFWAVLSLVSLHEPHCYSHFLYYLDHLDHPNCASAKNPSQYWGHYHPCLSWKSLDWVCSQTYWHLSPSWSLSHSLRVMDLQDLLRYWKSVTFERHCPTVLQFSPVWTMTCHFWVHVAEWSGPVNPVYLCCCF